MCGTPVQALPVTSPTPRGQDRPPGPGPSRKGHLGWVVAGSLVTGVLAALLLAGAPFIPATESGVTGAILAGLALGWAMVAVLSVRFTDQPQKWAVAPALFLGLGGFLLVAFGSPMQEALAWVWPPALLVLAVWMIFQAHRRLRSRSGRFLLYPVIAMLVLASLGGGFETLRGAADAAAFPVQGRLVDVGGHRLYLDCTGSGSPTVVLEPGAGLMLQRGNVPGPYVLAGHSLGGPYALTFAARYPEEVAGLVLVDSTPPASDPESAQPARPDSDDTTNRVSALVAGAARLGLGPLSGVAPNHLRSTIEEYLQAGSSVQQAAALRSFTDKPLAVL